MLISAGMGTLYPPGWAEYPLRQGVFKQRLEWGVSSGHLGTASRQKEEQEVAGQERRETTGDPRAAGAR